MIFPDAVDSLLLFVKDPHMSAEFYGRLGFDNVSESPDFAMVRLGNFNIRCQNETRVKYSNDSGVEPKGLGVFAYIRVGEIDGYYEELLSRGLKPSSSPSNQPWGNREFAIRDPDEYKLIFYKPLV